MQIYLAVKPSPLYDNNHYHEECLRCNSCGLNLTGPNQKRARRFKNQILCDLHFADVALMECSDFMQQLRAFKPQSLGCAVARRKSSTTLIFPLPPQACSGISMLKRSGPRKSNGASGASGPKRGSKIGPKIRRIIGPSGPKRPGIDSRIGPITERIGPKKGKIEERSGPSMGAKNGPRSGPPIKSNGAKIRENIGPNKPNIGAKRGPISRSNGNKGASGVNKGRSTDNIGASGARNGANSGPSGPAPNKSKGARSKGPNAPKIGAKKDNKRGPNSKRMGPKIGNNGARGANMGPKTGANPGTNKRSRGNKRGPITPRIGREGLELSEDLELVRVVLEGVVVQVLKLTATGVKRVLESGQVEVITVESITKEGVLVALTLEQEVRVKVLEPVRVLDLIEEVQEAKCLPKDLR
uniref:LIM zinc-binding domain-containing protein n=1 Tax=Tenebrio molitor TaxID=7067 RepID=A0A8J6H3T4_TENMO|nr:hypothetical protein GEV33_015178 [Tenebrio molitor]